MVSGAVPSVGVTEKSITGFFTAACINGAGVDVSVTAETDVVWFVPVAVALSANTGRQINARRIDIEKRTIKQRPKDTGRLLFCRS